MELEAARAGLVAICRRGWETEHEVVLHCDSTIVLDVITGAFTPRPLRYATAVAALRSAAIAAGASTQWVPSHVGHRWNEHVDRLAALARTGGSPATPSGD